MKIPIFVNREMTKVQKAKTKELQQKLAELGVKLCAGDDSQLLVWVIPGKLACAHRPLRKHPSYCGSQIDLPSEASPLVLAWVQRVKQEGIRSVIALMGDKELRHYNLFSIGASGLIDLYKREGLCVRRLNWEDPAHQDVSTGLSYEQQIHQCQTDALVAYDEFPKPILMHCSSGIQRSSPVAAFIFDQRGEESGDIQG